MQSDMERLWRDPDSGRNSTKAMRRADRKLAKFAEKAEDGKCYTLQETAEAMGVTRERVRQIEARALKKLRGRLGQIFRNEDITPEDILEVLPEAAPRMSPNITTARRERNE